MDNLLSLLKDRHENAKRFSKDYHERVKNELKAYTAENEWLSSYSENNKLYLQVIKRYEIIIPLIFTQHEGMLASMFDRVPDLLVNQRGQQDEEKAKKIQASYEYLKDKLSLEQFMNTAAWWYLLTGFTSSHVGYVKKTREVPVYDEQTGEIVLNEEGEPLTRIEYEIDDPEVTVDSPGETHFAPDSEYSIKADKVPYYTREKLMTQDDVLKTYDKIVKTDTSLKISDDKLDNQKDKDSYFNDLARVKVMMYYGGLPSKAKSFVEEQGLEYDIDGWYYFVFTSEEILHAERMPDDLKTCSLLKWYGAPNKFYGFGLAKLLEPFQKEKSLRRTQQARYADVAAFPKLLVPVGTDIDENAAADPREVPMVLFDGDAPSYLTPPDVSNTLISAEEKADQDAQQASGMLDVSQGSQSSNTVDTATGQTIFAEAADKRIRYAKKNFMEYYKNVVVLLLKMAQLYWDEEKVVSLTDAEGNQEEVYVSAQDLSDVDFDTDIAIDPDSLTINKDVLRAQAIELYNISKDDPLVDRRELFMNMLRVGFDTADPEKYIKESEVPPGTQLIDPQTGQQFRVDESGNLVSAQDQMEMAQPTGEADVPTDPAGLMGSSQMV